MKKTICILLSVYSILTYSCKKDKKETASIIGKWYWVDQTYDDYTNDKLTDHRDYTTTLDPLSYFEFKVDGTFIENPQDRNGLFEYGKYQIAGDSLFVKRDIDQKATRYAIKKITSSSLVIHFSGSSSIYRGEVEYTMKRQ